VREDAARFAVPSTLAEYFVHAPDNVPKPLVLLHVIKRINISKAIIFTNSNESATRLSKLLGSIISCAAFTSVQSSAARQIMLKRFKDGTIQFLIASDLISRGLDTATPVIINYASSVPARQYIHRVGRTARAGNEGLAVSIVEASEAKYWWNQIGSAGKISRGDREVQRVTLFKKRDAPIEHTIELNEVDQDDLQRKYDEALQSLQHGDQDAQSISHFPPSIRRGPP
jgi:superfamily II DNA/RNA helicase